MTCMEFAYQNKVANIQNLAHDLVEEHLILVPGGSLATEHVGGAFVLDSLDSVLSRFLWSSNEEDHLIFITNKDSKSLNIIQACQSVVGEGCGCSLGGRSC